MTTLGIEHSGSLCQRKQIPLMVRSSMPGAARRRQVSALQDITRRFPDTGSRGSLQHLRCSPPHVASGLSSSSARW